MPRVPIWRAGYRNDGPEGISADQIPVTRSCSWRSAWVCWPFCFIGRSSLFVHSFLYWPGAWFLTVALYQPYEWLSLRLGGRPKLAAVIVTVTCLLIIIGPATWLGLGMIDGLQNFAGQLGTGTLTIPSPPEGVKDWPLLGAQIYGLLEPGLDKSRGCVGPGSAAPQAIAGPVLAFAGSAGVGTLQFILSVALSGFLFIYGPRLVEAIRRIQARVVTQRGEDFVALAGLTIRMVAQGVIGVAVLQSLLAGVGLQLAGVPHAGRAGVRRAGACDPAESGRRSSCFPSSYGFGRPRIWRMALPLTIYLVIVGLADNILKPILMGRGLNTPMLVIFIGVLGG